MSADRPRCKCHGEPMVAPGQWLCAVKERARKAVYRAANREVLRERSRKYNAEHPEIKIAQYLRLARRRRAKADLRDRNLFREMKSGKV